MLPVQGKPILDWQLQELESLGCTEVIVVTGFGHETVSQFLKSRPASTMRIRIRYNPFHSVSDNLATCWLVRDEMSDDFVLINGDTLFEAPLLRRLLNVGGGAVRLAVDCKERYDDDDMKVSLAANGQLRHIGKTLDPESVNAESVGVLYFEGDGPKAFVDALERVVQEPDGLQAWYLSAIDRMASEISIEAVSIEGLKWCEIDYPVDYRNAQSLVDGWIENVQALSSQATMARPLNR